MVVPVPWRFLLLLKFEINTSPGAIVPPVGIDFSGTALVFPDTKSRRIEIPVKANTGKTSGDLRLELLELRRAGAWVRAVAAR